MLGTQARVPGRPGLQAVHNTPNYSAVKAVPQPLQKPLKRRLLSRLSVAARASDGDKSSVQPPMANTENPLELLRVTREPQKRVALLQQLDGTWSDWEERYQPCDVELCLMKELGLGQQAVMLAAVQKPELCSYSAVEQVQPCTAALKTAGIDNQAIFFLLSRSSPHLMGLPPGCLQRWLDFLAVYGLAPRDLLNFMQRASRTMLEECTIYQAGVVAKWLKDSLGLKDDYLAQRIFAIYPQVFGRDVEHDLAPITAWLMGLGLSPQEVSKVVQSWPEVLLKSAGQHLAPFKAYLVEQAGCFTAQVADVVRACPHLLGMSPEEVFGQRLAQLAAAGLGREEVKGMLGRAGPAFLAASGGVADQLAWLASKGFNREEVKAIVMARPQVLCEKPHELDRKWSFIATQLVGPGGPGAGALPQLPSFPSLRNTLLQTSTPSPSPSTSSPSSSQSPSSSSLITRSSEGSTGAGSSSGSSDATSGSGDGSNGGSSSRSTTAGGDISAGTVTGSNEVQQQGAGQQQAGKDTPGGEAGQQEGTGQQSGQVEDNEAAVRAAVLAAPILLSEHLGLTLGPRTSFVLSRPAVAARFSVGSSLDYNLLLALPDEEWVEAAGVSSNEYAGHRNMWEERYDAQLYLDSAQEFQAELKKLGAYEGQ